MTNTEICNLVQEATQLKADNKNLAKAGRHLFDCTDETYESVRKLRVTVFNLESKNEQRIGYINQTLESLSE